MILLELRYACIKLIRVGNGKKMQKWKNPTSLHRLLRNMIRISDFGSTLLGVPEKEIAKMFVTGLKPDLFREEIYSRSCETLQEAMDESRAVLSSYRNIWRLQIVSKRQM